MMPHDHHPGSRLPHNSGYWDRLADRVMQDAAGPLADYRALSAAWWSPLARLAPALAAAAVVALLVAWLAGPSRAAYAAPSPIAEAVTPPDPLARTVLGDTPPSIDSLLTHTAEPTP